MRKIFVDSNYIIDYLRGKDYTKPLIEKVKSKQIEAHISAATLFELYVGALLSNNSEKKFEDIESLLAWFQVVDINKEIMRITAKIHVTLRKKGSMIELQDIFIAASSIAMGMPLLTNNRKHFERINDLEVKSWEEYLT